MTQADPISAYASTRDAEAFSQVVNTYQRLVFATCRRKLHDQADLDDAVQETFLKLAQKAGELRTNAGGWLHRCAVNVAIDINRRRTRREKHETAAAGRKSTASNDPQQVLTDLREQIDLALDKLDPDQRELIIQRYFVGRPQVELASEANVSPSTITHRLDRAIETLRGHLQALGCGTLTAGGTATVSSLLEAEAASASVPAALTANVMKIGLSGMSGTTAAAGSAALGTVLASVAAGIIVLAGVVGLGIWALGGKQSTNVTQVQSPAPALRPTPTAQPPAAVTGATGFAQGAQPPQWDPAQPPAPAAVLSGRVLDRAGKPVPRAVVEVTGPAGAMQATADDQGNYSFATVRREGEYQFAVRADGFVPIEPYVSKIPNVQLTAQSRSRRDLVLERGVPVTVVVKSFTGQPVARARIDVNSPDERRSGTRNINTDADGVARLVLLPSKVAYTVAAVLDGFAPAHTTITPADVDTPIEVELTVAPGISISGVAICKDGKPATGWSIIAYPDWWTTGYVPNGALIDAEGKFTLKDLNPGEHRLMISIPMGEGTSTTSLIATMTLPPADNQPLRLDIARASPGTLTKLVGKVKFVGPAPDYVSVEAMSKSGDNNWYHGNVEVGRTRRGNFRLAPDEGQFSLEGLPAGEYRIKFESPSIEAKVLESVKVPGELTVVELKVVGKPRLAGTLVDASTGKPITHFAVRARKLRTLGQGANYVQDARWVQVGNPDGKFDIELVGPGVYQAQASIEGYAWLWSSETTVEKGKVEIQLKATAGGSFTGHVRDPAGQPVEGASVIAHSMARSTAMRGGDRFESEAGAVTTDAQGRFTLPHLAAGDEMLKVMHKSFAPAVASAFKVIEGQPTDIGTIKLKVGGTVEGVICDAQGNPSPGVALQFQDASGYGGSDDEATGRVATVSTDEKGYFRVEHLPEQILYVNQGERWERLGVVRRIVRPLDGKTARLDFGGPYSVKGKLLDNGKPVSNRRIELSTQSPHFGSNMTIATTDQEGRFCFFGPPVGTYTLYSQADGQRGDWIGLRKVQVTGQPTDLGDVSIDSGEVVISIEADDADDLKSLQYVHIQRDEPGRAWQESVTQATVAPDAANTWRALHVPAGHFRIQAYKADSQMSIIVPFDHDPAKSKQTKVRLHIPRSSATLNARLKATSAGDSAGNLSATIQSERGIKVWIGDQIPAEPTKSLKLPPGTYRQLDTLTGEPRQDVPEIVLKAGESQDAQIDVESSGLVTANLRVWDANGLPLLDARPRLLDGQGTEIKPRGDTDLGTMFLVEPGSYRAVLDNPKVDRQIEVPTTKAMQQGWNGIDLVVD